MEIHTRSRGLPGGVFRPGGKVTQPVLQYNLAGMDPVGEEPLKYPPVIARISIRYNDLDPYGHVNNAAYLEFFEEIRLAYWRALADLTGFDELEAGDVPGARYVIAETTVRYKAPIFLDDALHGAAIVPTVGNRSYAMDFELRTGETFEEGLIVAEGFAAHAFFDPSTDEVKLRPDWFLPAVAELEGRPEESFIPVME
jgi:acyl-CoA thioester hydrolase